MDRTGQGSVTITGLTWIGLNILLDWNQWTGLNYCHRNGLDWTE